MKKILFLFCLIVIAGCSTPTDLPVPEMFKPAESFGKNFIRQVVRGQLDSAYNEVTPGKLDDTMKATLMAINSNLQNVQAVDCKTVNLNLNKDLRSGYTVYDLAFEYETVYGEYILFMLKLSKSGNVFTVDVINERRTEAPVAQLTGFTFTHRSIS